MACDQINEYDGANDCDSNATCTDVNFDYLNVTGQQTVLVASQKPHVNALTEQRIMVLAVELALMLMNALLELTTVLITRNEKI